MSTVLVVEDDEKVLRLMTRVLSDEGHRVLAAKDGVEAWTTVRTYGDSVSLAVIDIGLPKLDGLSLAARLSDLIPKPSVLFITGSWPAEGELPQQVIGKPFSVEDFLSSVTRLLDEAESEEGAP